MHTSSPKPASPRTLLALAAVALLATLPASAATLKVYYPDIEQGNATLLVSPTGSAMLIDAGSEIRYADDDVVVFIQDLMDAGIVTSLDYTVATHYDEDHIGHLEDIMSYGLMSSGGIAYDRGTYQQTPTSFAYSDYAFAASSHNRTTITPGQVINLGGGVTVTCLVVNGDVYGGSPVDITTSNQFENAAAVGLLVQYGDFDLWIAGDLTGNIEEYGVADVEAEVGPVLGDIDVYTVHHHGSRTGSTADFLAYIQPEVAINQNSADNGFGHPNSITVNNVLSQVDTCNHTPLFIQQNPGNSTDSRSDDSLADAIADPDDVDSVLGLAGTLLLVTDGTDFQISGGNVPPFTLPADCSSTATADFAPTVLNVQRSPWVPLSTQSTTVQAEVRDEGSFTATLHWSLDGVTQTPISMSQVGSTAVYQGTIPAQTDGSRVSYVVEGEDGGSQTAASAPQGYFSGVTDVADLRLNDANGVLVPAAYAARVEGNVTVEPGIFHTFVSQIYVQDSTGGIQVFDGSLLPLDRGDLVQFVGELEQFSGQTELTIAQSFGGYGYTDLGTGSAPTPALITVAQAGEAYEGKLVRIDGVTITSGTIPGPGAGNGYLTITDDGGTSTLTLKVDTDTDIPGAGTPTQAFDVIGVLGQSDSWPAFDDYYQIQPRERADLLSDEVNLPDVLIHEIHADPHTGQGDANGDGTRSATDDEFVELANTTYAAVDVSGWTISDGGSVRHTFANGTVIPPREAAVVFGGGTPTGDFGHAAANGLVFTASTGGLSLNNGGDTVTLKDDLGNVVQSVTYGSEGGHDVSLTRNPDMSNSPLAEHDTVSTGNERFSPGTWAVDGEAFTIAEGDVVVSEVLYDAVGADGGYEWIELVNLTDHDIDLSLRPLSLGWGGNDYTSGGLTLDSGTLLTCAPFVVGGAGSDASINSAPSYDLVADFSPDLQNSGATADGVALFNLDYAYVDATTVPISAVIYGTSNDNCLLDESGSCGAVDVGDVSSGGSVERTTAGGAWQTQSSPTPNSSPLITGMTCSGGGGGGGGGGGSTCLDASSLGAGDLVISEVFYDSDGTDNGWEWIELYNASGSDVCLDGLSLGWGGSDYTYGQQDLSGTMSPDSTWVIGGVSSGTANGSPTYDDATDLSPDLQNGGSDSDGVALFLDVAANVTSSTTPYDAVIYDSPNTNCLLDETGSCGSSDVGDASAGSSIERTSIAGAWQIQSTPTPGTAPLP